MFVTMVTLPIYQVGSYDRKKILNTRLTSIVGIKYFTACYRKMCLVFIFKYLRIYGILSFTYRLE